jgi:hypothetical protein
VKKEVKETVFHELISSKTMEFGESESKCPNLTSYYYFPKRKFKITNSWSKRLESTVAPDPSGLCPPTPFLSVTRIKTKGVVDSPLETYGVEAVVCH